MRLLSYLQKYSFALIIFFLLGIIFNPIVLKNQIPFSSNLLVSFFNPWAHEPIVGWPQGVPNKPVGIDDIRIFYPQRHFTTESLQNFSLPLWDPYIFSGGYHAGLSETAVFYPLFLLFLIVPQLPFWIGMIVVQPIVAAVGMYVFLRFLMSSKSAAIFGGITFGFSGLMIVRMIEGLSVGHALIWIPWALFTIEAFFQKRQSRYVLLLLLFLLFPILAGWFQFAFYCVIFSFAYALFRYALSRKTKDLFIFTPFVLLPFVALFQIIPALESFAVSSRGVTSTQTLLNLHLMPWSHILTYFFPDFWGNPGSYNFFGKSEYKESILFIGIVPIILSLFSLWNIKNPTIRFFWAVAIVGIFLGIDSVASRSILSLPIPIVSSFLPNRVFYFATFSLSILSAFGFERVIHNAKKLFPSILLTGVGVLIFAGLVNLYVFLALRPQVHLSVLTELSKLHLISQEYQLLIAQHNLYISDILIGLCFVVLLCKHWLPKKFIMGMFFLLTIIGQVYFAQKYVPFSQKEFVFPPSPVFTYLSQNAGINRYISTGNGYISSNSSLYFDIYSPDGVGSMYIGRYGEVVTYAQSKGKDYMHIPRIEIRLDPSADEVLSGSDPYILRFMQIDGIKYVVRLTSDPAHINSELFTKVWNDNNWEIYSYNKTNPRIFWTNDIVVSKQQKDILKKIFSSGQKSIVLENNPQIPLDKHTKGEVTILVYKPSEIKMISNATGNGYVYISDNFAKQFYATVDGKEVEILRSNYSFKAIPVPSGKHTIIVRYKDPFETLGFMVAGIAFLGFGYVLLALHKGKLQF